MDMQVENVPGARGKVRVPRLFGPESPGHKDFASGTRRVDSFVGWVAPPCRRLSHPTKRGRGSRGGESKHLAAKLREDLADLAEEVIAVRTAELVDARAIPALFPVIDDRGRHDRPNLGVEIR